MTRPTLALSLAASLILAPGCSLFVPHTQVLQVTASDASADILIDGQLQGRGTVATRVARNRSHTVLARLDERVGTVTVDTTISTTGILDIIGTWFFIIPIVGIVAPGFWKLDQDSVVVVLPPSDEAPAKVADVSASAATR